MRMKRNFPGRENMEEHSGKEKICAVLGIKIAVGKLSVEESVKT